MEEVFRHRNTYSWGDRFLVLAVAAVTLLGLVAPATAGVKNPIQQSDQDESRPLRSGSILGGFFIMGTPGCQRTPDCQLWLGSNCSSDAIFFTEPALYTAFVDVADMAGSPQKRLVQVTPSTKVAVVWGGLRVELWQSDCSRINTGPRTLLVRPGWPIELRIPTGARWMTLTSADSTQLDWTLT